MVKNWLVNLIRALLVLAAVFVVYCLITVPLGGRLMRYMTEGALPKWFIYAFAVSAAGLALWILAELYAVLATALSDPFVMRNARAFIRMGAAAEAAAVVFFVKTALEFTPMTLVCGAVMLLCGLFSLALAQVFRRAVELKLENDLTI